VNRLSAENRSAEMVLCIANCAQCHASCIEAISYCLLKGEGYAQERHISLLATCADMCSTSADTMLRGADVHSYTCAACASICEQCADSCSRLRDPEMTKCAEACRRCADSCADMSPK
jgi:hypothetical protein